MARYSISVVIPAFNEEKRIKWCLESILNQDYKGEYEVLLVDNNSTDNTVKIARKFFPKVKIVPELKQGVVFARVRGVQEAKGDIISFTDADSLVPDFWLSKISRAFLKSDIVGVGGSVNLMPKNTWVKFCETLINNFNLTFKTFHGANMSFKKEAYLRCGGFLPKMNLAEDFYLSLKLKKFGKIKFLANNTVTTSSRRFFDGFFPYAFGYLSNMVSLYLFDKPVFFKLRDLKEKSSVAFNFLENNDFLKTGLTKLKKK